MTTETTHSFEGNTKRTNVVIAQNAILSIFIILTIPCSFTVFCTMLISFLKMVYDYIYLNIEKTSEEDLSKCTE